MGLCHDFSRLLLVSLSVNFYVRVFVQMTPLSLVGSFRFLVDVILKDQICQISEYRKSQSVRSVCHIISDDVHFGCQATGNPVSQQNIDYGCFVNET